LTDYPDYTWDSNTILEILGDLTDLVDSNVVIQIAIANVGTGKVFAFSPNISIADRSDYNNTIKTGTTPSAPPLAN
jgi:hypothetical protein